MNGSPRRGYCLKLSTKSDVDRFAGILMIMLAGAVIVSIVTHVDIETAGGAFGGAFRESLQDLIADREQHLISVSFGLLANVLIVAVGALAYLILRPHDRVMALLGAFAFIAAGATLMVNDIIGIALATLAEDFEVANATQGNVILTIGPAIAAAGLAAFAIGVTFIGLGLLSYGAVIAWSGVVQRGLGWLAILSGSVVLLVWLGFLKEELFGVAFIGVMGVVLFLILTGFWVIIQGTKEPPATT